jgi:hypothetical protein
MVFFAFMLLIEFFFVPIIAKILFATTRDKNHNRNRGVANITRPPKTMPDLHRDTVRVEPPNDFAVFVSAVVAFARVLGSPPRTNTIAPSKIATIPMRIVVVIFFSLMIWFATAAGIDGSDGLPGPIFRPPPSSRNVVPGESSAYASFHPTL